MKFYNLIRFVDFIVSYRREAILPVLPSSRGHAVAVAISGKQHEIATRLLTQTLAMTTRRAAIFTIITILLFGQVAHASEQHAMYSTSKSVQKKDFFVKARAGANKLAIKDNSTLPGKKWRAAAEIGLSYFLIEYIAVELAAGYTPYFLDNKFNTLPLTITAQLHLPIDKRLVPYVGAGYSYRFVFFDSSTQKIKNAGSFAMQGGLDLFILDNDVGLNIDIKYVPNLKHTMTGSTNGDIKMSDLSLMAGIGIRF